MLETNNGSDASLAFETLLNEPDQKKLEKIRKNLLEYGKLDTLAMVEIINRLYNFMSLKCGFRF